MSAARRPRVWCVVAMSLLLVATAHAHPARLIEAQAVIESDGAYRLTIRFDLLAYLLNETPRSATDAAMNALLESPAQTLDVELAAAEKRMRGDTAIVCDGERALEVESIAFPSRPVLESARRADRLVRLPVIGEATLSGHLPLATRTVAFRAPEVLGDLVLTVERPGEEPWGEPVSAGTTSPALPIRLTPPATAASMEGTASTPGVDAPGVAPAPPSRLGTAARFFRWGFIHIVPRGLDHILFVLGLFLLSPRLRPVLWQVTAFTVAHAITLALAVFNLVHLPAAIVEPLIAASIACVAIENLYTRELKPWRPVVVFAFGLIHGLGFAGVLLDAGLPRERLLSGLIAFNVGVECGQLTVVAAALLLLGRFRDRAWYRRRVTNPLSLLIALVAITWTVTRTIDSFR